MNLIELYKQVISCGGWIADDDGFISMKLADLDPQPVLIDGKRLVLPLEYQLKHSDTSKRVVFHPLNESILRGESDVVTKLRMNINHRLNFVVGFLSISLMRLATSPAEHPSLKPDQTVFLSMLKDVDQQTNEKLQKLAAQMTMGDASKSFSHIYVSKRGDINGRKYARVGVVSFPLYEELCKDEAEVYGVKLRKKDRQAIKALIEYILPDIDKPATYRRGSDSKVAPTLDALMKAVIAVGDPINCVIDLFKDRLEGVSDLVFNGDWEPEFNDLEALLPQIRMIPMQAGNEGRIGHQHGVTPSANIPIVNLTTSAPAQVEQAVANAVAATPANRPRTLAEINTRALDEEVRQVSSQPPAPAPYPKSTVPVPGGYGHQHNPYQQQPQQPGFGHPMQQPMMHQPPQVVNTGNGISMDSVMRANPALAQRAAAAGFGPQNVFSTMQAPAQRNPSWMRPAQEFGSASNWNNFPNVPGNGRNWSF
jgi:hypothetical protein